MSKKEGGDYGDGDTVSILKAGLRSNRIYGQAYGLCGTSNIAGDASCCPAAGSSEYGLWSGRCGGCSTGYGGGLSSRVEFTGTEDARV